FYSSNETTTIAISPLSLHDALPICLAPRLRAFAPQAARHALASEPAAWRAPLAPQARARSAPLATEDGAGGRARDQRAPLRGARSEEHTSELQSRENLVCRLLLEKK